MYFPNLKRLFMKLCKEIEDEEKSNAIKIPATTSNTNELENSSDELDNMGLSSSLPNSVFDMF